MPATVASGATTRARIRRRRARRALLLVALATAAPALAATPPVFVEARENGQGLLRERNGECFVVTPEHVVAGSEEITVVAPGGSMRARMDTTFGADVAVRSRVVDRGRFGCGHAWDEGADLDALLTDATDGVLVTTTQTGAVPRRFVRIVAG